MGLPARLKGLGEVRRTSRQDALVDRVPPAADFEVKVAVLSAIQAPVEDGSTSSRVQSE